MSFQECIKKHSSKDFIRWQAYLELEPNQFNPLHHYLAQIAASIEYMLSDGKRQIRVEDKLIKFRKKKMPRVSKRQKQRQQQNVAEMQKAAFMSQFGLASDGTYVGKPSQNPIQPKKES
jgi:hypothetical protein